MDIKIDVAELSSETRELLLRFQVAHLHFIMREDFHNLPGESDWLDEFYALRRAFANCPEKKIAEAGRKFNSAGDEFDRECDAQKKLLTSDEYELWFQRRLTERATEVTALENALYRLSLLIGDRRPAFFRIIH